MKGKNIKSFQMAPKVSDCVATTAKLSAETILSHFSAAALSSAKLLKKSNCRKASSLLIKHHYVSSSSLVQRPLCYFEMTFKAN